MKRWISILVVLILLLGLSACGTSNSGYSSYAKSDSAYEYYDTPAASPSYAPNAAEESADWDGGFEDRNPEKSYDKIIYTANSEIQTLDFEASVERVRHLVEQFGGYIQSSSVTGTDVTRKYKTFRKASFTLRIPSDRFSGLQESLSDVGNVTYFNLDQDNISDQYYDVESRLTTYRTEESRLLSMLEKCETVEDMIAIESRLSDVRYSIESLTSTLRRYDQLVAYSTVYLNIVEVEKYVEEVPIVRGYWEQIGEGFVNSLKGVGNFFKNLFKFLLISFPYLVLIAVILLLLVLIFRPVLRRRRERKANQPEVPKENKRRSRKLRRKSQDNPETPDNPEGPVQL
ncbi:MAG: DUF4349 domain-containing protein [Oscillospiraceae bacterium]|nr:DUF4349 domain-containing protein [Oscillospiraceae bacterium]